MSLCNSNKDGCSLEAALDEIDELTSKTEAGIERTLKKVESEGCDTEKYQMEEERIKNMYKLRVLLHHGNKVNFKLPGTSIKEAASEASAKQIQYREEEETPKEASTKHIQCASEASAKKIQYREEEEEAPSEASIKHIQSPSQEEEAPSDASTKHIQSANEEEEARSEASMKHIQSASEASTKKIQNREEEDAATEASTKQIQYRPNSRYEFRNFRVKNYSLTGNVRIKIEKKDNMMKKELVIPIVDENHKSGIKRACVRKGVTNHEKDSTESRYTKKRKDMDEYELVDI